MHVEEWLQAIPSGWICVIVAAVIGLESLGIPLPGEVILVSSALLSAQHVVSPLWVGACASAGAIVGDSIGYAIGRRGGQPLFDRLSRRFPKHFGAAHVAKACEAFDRWGMWAVFFGRFIALLRILAGPLAGAMRMPYWRFLAANVTGGITWAGGTTAVIYYLGIVADKWLKGFSWAGLAVAALCGVATTVYVKRRASRARADAKVGEASGQRSMSVTSSE